MAPAARYAINRRTRQFARFFAGDEHGQAALPVGWEEVPDGRCPPGFVAVEPADGSGWFHPQRPPPAPGLLVRLRACWARRGSHD